MSTPGYSFMKQIDFRSGQTVTVTERHSQWVKNISEKAFLFLFTCMEMFIETFSNKKHFKSQVLHVAL